MLKYIILLLVLPALLCEPAKKIVLSEEPLVKILYSFPSDTRIRFSLIFKSEGYISFGFGGGMYDSDILICYFQDGIPQIKDTHSKGYTSPPEDASQDWTLISGKRKNGLTIFVVERDLKTGDSDDKDILVNAPQSVVWALGKSDTINYHSGDRGVVNNVVFQKNNKHL